MNRIICLFVSAAVALASLSITRESLGQLEFNLEQIGRDVVFTGNGTIDLTGMGFIGTFSQSGEISTASLFAVGPASSTSYDLYNASTSSGPAAIGPTTPGPFGSLTGTITSASSGSGDLFGLDFEGGVSILTLLPSGYVSGSDLSGTSTYVGESLASLGVSPGSYVWNVGVNTVTLNATAVPEPTAFFVVFGIGAAVLTRRQRTPIGT